MKKFVICYPEGGARPCDPWIDFEFEAPTLSAVAGMLANFPRNMDGGKIYICHPDGRVLAYIFENKVEYSRFAAAML